MSRPPPEDEPKPSSEEAENERLEARIQRPRRRRSFAGLVRGEAVGEEQDSWVITYMDVITLLLVFFVMMLAFADFANVAPVDRLIAELAQDRAEGEPSPPTAAAPAPTVTVPAPVQAEAGRNAEALSRTLHRIVSEAAGGEVADAVDVTTTNSAVVVDIPGSLLFASGTAALSPGGRGFLERLAFQLALGRILGDARSALTVEGHTDDVPISSAAFPSNWELASDRANAVLRYLLDQGLPARNVRSVSYGSLRPRAPNDTVESRAENRRVTLVFHARSRDVVPREGAR